MGAPRIDKLDRNLQINGNFDYWQRGSSFAAATNGQYTADRFFYTKSGSGVHTVLRSTDVPNLRSRYSLQLDCTTADASIAAGDLYSLSTRMEGNFLRLIAGQKFSMSFWVKAPKVGIYCVSFRNAAADRSYVVEYEVFQADTWEQKFLPVVEHDVSGSWNYDHQEGLRIDWVLATGTDRQNSAGVWHSGNYVATSNQVNAVDNVANNFFISQVMILFGEVIPEQFCYAGRDPEEELKLCQRYYHRLERGVNFNGSFFGWRNTDGGWGAGPYKFPVAMRVVPAFSVSSLAQFNMHIPTVNNTSFQAFGANFVTSGNISNAGQVDGTEAWTFGGACPAGGPNTLNFFPNTVGAWMAWDAEL